MNSMHTVLIVGQDWSGMSDLIRREDAIKILSERAKSLRGMLGDLGGACRGAMRIIELLPSAESEERKKGKWQRRKGSDCWECSQCHAVLEDDDLGMHNFYFCYHCGANMMDKSGYMDIEEVHYG